MVSHSQAVTEMALSPICSLPLDCLLEIAKNLQQIHAPSLLSFTLLCKQFYYPGAVLLYQTRTINVRSRSHLHEQIARITPEIRSYIRKLVINGRMPRKHEDLGDAADPTNQSTTSYRESTNIVYEEDDAWLILANLITSLVTLSDLIYDCGNQFSPCLLRALHAHHPTCRLHLESFHLVSLVDAEPDAHEVALGTSPCLYRLHASCGLVKADYVRDFTHDAIMELVSGLAPNLKEVSISWRRPKATLRTPTSPANACKSLILQKNQALRIGALHALEETRDDLSRWAKVTDFSVLRVLKLCKCTVSLQTLQYLANCHLSSLEELYFNTSYLYDAPELYDGAIADMLRHLPPLTRFSLTGHVGGLTFYTIISHHHSELQGLQLDITAFHITNIILRDREIEMIRDTCLKLQDLTVTIARSGDVHELAVYQALGSMKTLRHLSIRLDASSLGVGWIADDDLEAESYDSSNYDSETPNDDSFDQFQAELFPARIGNGRKIRNGHVMNALIKSAFDEPLARSIYSIISSNRTLTTPLESLHIGTIEGENFGAILGQGQYPGSRARNAPGRIMLIIIQAVSRSFKIERGIRDDRQSDCDLVVSETTNPRVLELAERVEKLEGVPEQIFRRIWPLDPGTGEKHQSWRDTWSGFPLPLLLGQNSINVSDSKT